MISGKTFRLVVTAVAVVAVSMLVWMLIPSRKSDPVAMTPARISDIATMVSLSTVDIYEEQPIIGRIGSKHLVARQTLTGSVSFDLEKLVVDTAGDTLRVILPPETVELYESTEPGSYVVIDTWNDRLLGSGLTTREENAIKTKAMSMARKRIYAKGYVRRARAEAVANLAQLLRPLAASRPVMIIDPTPAGNRD